MKTHDPIHPGEVLREDFLIPIALLEYRVAKDIGVPPRRIVRGGNLPFDTVHIRIMMWM